MSLIFKKKNEDPVTVEVAIIKKDRTWKSFYVQVQDEDLLSCWRSAEIETLKYCEKHGLDNVLAVKSISTDFYAFSITEISPVECLDWLINREREINWSDVE